MLKKYLAIRDSTFIILHYSIHSNSYGRVARELRSYSLYHDHDIPKIERNAPESSRHQPQSRLFLLQTWARSQTSHPTTLALLTETPPKINFPHKIKYYEINLSTPIRCDRLSIDLVMVLRITCWMFHSVYTC